VVTPKPGESLPSWIDRLAEDMHRPPGLVADDLGLRVVVNAQRFVSLLFGIVAADGDRAAVRVATGVSAEVFDGMHLSVYDGTVLDLSDLAADKVSLQRVRLREWALFTTSRACPDCLAASGGVWQLWWRLAAAAVCPTHRLVLASYCPGCRMDLRGGTDKHQGLPPRQELVAPTLCANRIGRGMCRYPLTALPRVPVGEEICGAQMAYLDAAWTAPAKLEARLTGSRPARR
jgi:hypothetical protein